MNDILKEILGKKIKAIQSTDNTIFIKTTDDSILIVRAQHAYDHDATYIETDFIDGTKWGELEPNTIPWITEYMEEEAFSKEHIEAIAKLVGFLNYSAVFKKSILDFVTELDTQYHASM